MAQGSHTTLGKYPRVCHTCGEKIVVSSQSAKLEALWFHAEGNELYSFHMSCFRWPHPLKKDEEDM